MGIETQRFDFDSKALRTNGRPLSGGEITFLRTVFYGSLNYEIVYIRRGLPIPLKTEALTIDNVIFFDDPYYSDDFSVVANINDLALLAHEAMHVWQGLNLHYGWPDSMFEHIRYGDRVYCYDLDPRKKLTKYRFEQQGRIVQDYVEKRAGNDPDIHHYEKVIYASIPKI